ncbi:MAG: TRAP transporter small permease [Gammaproteobacteria bacterium]|nr:TRAP transporter small permease [Gammaproteobacteria bacterium]
MSDAVKRFRHIVRLIEDGLLAFLLTSMIILAVTQIVMRNLWQSGIIWGDPALRLMVLWVALLGAMVATREDSHVRIDILSRFLPTSLTRAAARITDLFSASVCGLLTWHSGRFVYLERLDGALLSGLLPAWWCELILPIGFGVMTLRFLLAVISGRQNLPIS